MSPEIDLDRLYGAPNLDELRDEYERIASRYDDWLVGTMGYHSHKAMADACRRLVPEGALILDVGAGTGLLGAELLGAGFTAIDALDLSAAMLAEAERKGIYRTLTEATLGKRLPYGTDAYDATVAAGVLTTGHAPASSFDELVRVTRPGGHVVFTLRSDQSPPGFDDKIAELLERGNWALVERGDEFQAMPIGEPEVLVRVWAFRVV
jgi:predicted TPR repeat methyltransferase